MSDPKQIWLSPECHEHGGEGRQWCEDDVWDDCNEFDHQCPGGPHGSVRYVLAADYDALKARVAELESALRLAKLCVERDLKAAVKENFGYVNNDPWACAAVDARNAIDAALAGQQQGEPHNCERDGHLPIGWGGPVFCELCSARLPDEPELDKPEQPATNSEDGPDERAALAPAAVVMPARMTTIPEGKTIPYAAGYEDALDAVANLNRVTVPMDLRRAIDELRAILGAKP